MPELRSVRLAEDDCARSLDALHHNRVLIGDTVFERERATRGADALRHFQVLDGYWNAVQRAKRIAAHHGILGVPCSLHRLVSA